MKPLLKISNLSINFKVRNTEFSAVKNLNLEIAENQIVGLVGESGSGKSVTAMSVMRLLPEPKASYGDDSSIIFDGTEILSANQNSLRSIRGNKISMIFQEPMTSLNPYHRVGDQIVESILLHKAQPKSDAVLEAKNLMNLVEIPEVNRRFTSYPHELSGGQRQRIMIAMALANKPKLLIADEPTTALDVTIQAQILDLMQDVTEKSGASLLVITHNLGIVARYADRVAVMYAGKLREVSEATDLYSEPHHPYTVGLLQSVPRLDSEKGAPLTPIAGEIPDLTDLPEGCAFNPRCQLAVDKCRVEQPMLEESGPSRQVACFEHKTVALGI